MKRDEKFNLINELSVAVTDKTVYDHELKDDRVEYLANTKALKINGALDLKRADEGKVLEEETEEEILEALKPNYIDGLSLLGGEPFEPENQEVLVKLLRKVKIFMEKL